MKFWRMECIEVGYESVSRSVLASNTGAWTDRPPHKQGRIQEFILGGPNQGPLSKFEGEARFEGAKLPSIEGKARVEGAKRPKIEGDARTEGKAREKAGGGVWGGGSVRKSRGRGLGRGLGEPLPRKFKKNHTWNHSFWCIFEAFIWID